MALLATLTMCVIALYLLRWAEGIGDDYYFYRIGLPAAQSAVGAQIQRDLMGRADSLSMSRYDRQDLRVKSKAAVNYPLLRFTVGLAHAERASTSERACRDEFSTLVLPTLIRGWTLQFAICLGVTLLVLLLCADGNQLRGFALFVLVLSLLEFALVPPRLDWRLAESETLRQLAVAVGQFFLNPAVNLSPFGHTGRNAFLLLLPAFGLLRWSRWARFSYCLLPLMMGVHQINTLMTMLLLIPFDLYRRPALFRQWPTLVSISVVCLVFLRGNPLAYSVESSALSGVVLLVLATGVALTLTLASAAVATRLFRRDEATAAGPTPILPEIGYLAVVMCITAIATWGIVQAVGADAAKFTWSELSGRLVSVVRMLILFGLSVLVVRAAAAAHRPIINQLLGLATVVGLLGLVVATGVRIRKDTLDPMAGFREEDRAFQALRRGPVPMMLTQDIVLYLSARGARCGRDAVRVPLQNLRGATRPSS